MRSGAGFIFDTHMIHRGNPVGRDERTTVIAEFHLADKCGLVQIAMGATATLLLRLLLLCWLFRLLRLKLLELLLLLLILITALLLTILLPCSDS